MAETRAATRRFPWPADGAAGAADSLPGSLPSGGPLGEFAAEAEILSRPAVLGRPWVLASEERVVKAYDLRGFGALDRRQALAEADTALMVSGVDGVVVTHRAEQLGHWLVIEMERLGESLAARLAAIAQGRAEPLPPARWGELFEAVAEALAALHRRGIVHRDIKPANLLFDRAGERLVVADFSISARYERRGSQSDEVAGTRRFIAPEVFHGRIGYGVDQYALAITAQDALGPAAPRAATEVLRRAAAQSPEDRFARIADFGMALRGALDRGSPYRLSARLQRVTPKWRCTWSLGGLTFAAAYLFEFAARPPGLTPVAAIGGPLIFAAMALAGARLAQPLRGKRTRPRLGVADRGWFPLLLFAVFAFTSRDLLAADPAKAKQVIVGGAVGALAIAALLGSTPPEAGERLIAVVRRWEHRQAEADSRRATRWTTRLALLAGLIAFGAVPVAVSKQWPNDTSPATGRDYPQLVTVARSRSALLSGDPRSACRLMRIPAAPDVVPCQEWAPLAARWLRADLRLRGGLPFGTSELGRIDVSDEGADQSGLHTWGLWLEGSPRLYPGALGPEQGSSSVWEVLLGRDPPQSDPLAYQEAAWGYEVVDRAGSWVITSIEICDFGEEDPCLRIAEIPKSEWKQAASRRPT